MVPGPRARESRSPLDSRGPLPTWRGASSVMVYVRTAPPGGCALAITAGQYRPPMAHGPLSETLEGPFLFYTARLYCGTGLRLRLALAPTAGQYRPLAAHSSCRNTASGAFSFFAACAILRCHAGLRFGIVILVFFTLFLSHNVSLTLV